MIYSAKMQIIFVLSKLKIASISIKIYFSTYIDLMIFTFLRSTIYSLNLEFFLYALCIK